MSDYLSLLTNVQSLADKSTRFDRMTPAQQAGHRAAVTRARTKAEELGATDLLDALNAITEAIGEAEKAERERMTAESLVEEYAKYQGYSPRQRAAYRAKISRLLNSAKEEGDAETVAALESLNEKMTADEVAAWKRALLATLKNLKADS